MIKLYTLGAGGVIPTASHGPSAYLDHVADLAPLLFALHSVLASNRQPLLLADPWGLADYLARLQDLYGDWLEPRHRLVVEQRPDAAISAATGIPCITAQDGEMFSIGLEHERPCP